MCGSFGLVHSAIVNCTELDRDSVYFSIHWRMSGVLKALVLIILMNMNCSRRVKLHRDDVTALEHKAQCELRPVEKWEGGGGETIGLGSGTRQSFLVRVRPQSVSEC